MQVWFYIAFGLFQILAVVPLIALSVAEFVIVDRLLNAELSHEEAALYHAQQENQAAEWAEDVQEAQVDNAKHRVARNAAKKGLHLEL